MADCVQWSTQAGPTMEALIGLWQVRAQLGTKAHRLALLGQIVCSGVHRLALLHVWRPSLDCGRGVCSWVQRLTDWPCCGRLCVVEYTGWPCYGGPHWIVAGV